MFKFVVDPCSKETGSKLYFTVQARLWWQHLVTCEPFFSYSSNGNYKWKEPSFILASTADVKRFFQEVCWSLPMVLFRVVLTDQHGLWATGDDKLWALAHLPKFSCQYTCAVQRASGKIMFDSSQLNLCEIKEVTNALRTLDTMSKMSSCQVPCCVEHFTYWSKVYQEVSCANRL